MPENSASTRTIGNQRKAIQKSNVVVYNHHWWLKRNNSPYRARKYKHYFGCAMAGNTKTMFKPKFLLVAIFAIVCCFFAATFFMNWDTALVEKNLADAETDIKKVLQTKSRDVAIEHCPRLIKTLNEGIPQFVKKGGIAEQAKSIKLISDCQIAMKDYQGAAASFAKLVRMEPQASRWHGQMAEALFHQRRDGEALRAAHLAGQLTPTDYKWPLLKARILRRMQMPAEAVVAYQDALALAPYDQAQQISIELNAMSGADNNDKADQ